MPPNAGLSLKPEHFRPALESTADGLWFEVHPENYMEAGGPRLAWLEAIRAERPLTFHGVGLSLGGPGPLDTDHLRRWRELVDRYEPALVSEHLAWSALDGAWFNDLLPTPMTQAALDRFCEHVDTLQTALGRSILVENPSRYLPLKGEMDEADFLAEAVRRTGCGLLLDVNNLYITGNNLGQDIKAWLDRVPLSAVGEIHVAGHEADAALGGALLIDTHGAPVSTGVWALLDSVLQRTGPCPVLVERDTAVPGFATLLAERDQAQAALSLVSRERADA
ncbi:MNIO family bufferin maturase [Maricaulis sp. CAU 1757]